MDYMAFLYKTAFGYKYAKVKKILKKYLKRCWYYLGLYIGYQWVFTYK